MRFALALLFFAPLAGFAAEAASAARPTPAELRALATAAEQELRGNILPFWLKHARNPATGGFHSFIGEDMTVSEDRPRGALLTSRILWTFSAAYRKYRDPEYLAMAQWAYRDQSEHFTDREHGGLFWTITTEGAPLDAHKQVYGQAFAIYALAEYYRATGEPAALAQAIAIYRLIEQHAADPTHGGYFDTLDRAWQRQPRTADNVLGDAPKSQNSHIHLLEAFTNLLRVWPDAGLRERQRQLTELMLDRIINPRTHHLVLYLREDWTPIGEEVSYGHDIELSWLLVEAAEVLGDPALEARARAKAVAIAEATNAQGVDADGGVYLEGNAHGATKTDKEWWEQAEAAVGFLNAYQISGDPRHFAWAKRSWDFIQAKFVDRQNGDWHNMLRRDGTVIMARRSHLFFSRPMAKADLWKCPYHNSRSCLELMERLEQLAGAAEPRK